MEYDLIINATFLTFFSTKLKTCLFLSLASGPHLLELLLGGGLGLEGGLVFLLHVTTGLTLSVEGGGNLISLGVDLDLSLLELGLEGLTLGKSGLGIGQVGADTL